MLYYIDNSKFILFENYKSIKNDKINFTLDKEQIIYFAMSGYTFNNKTIYKNIKPLKQGCYIHFKNNNYNMNTSFNKNYKKIFKYWKKIKRLMKILYEIKDSVKINKLLYLYLLAMTQGCISD